MKPVFAKKAARPDPELLTLKAELLEAQGDLAQAYRQFDQALDPKIIAAILAGFFLVALIRVFSSPFRLALKLLLNTLLGFLALGAVRLTAGLTGIALGLNLWNALVIAVLGLPGFVLLLLVQWVL